MISATEKHRFIKDFLLDSTTLSDLAKKYHITVDNVRIRARNLGLINTRKRKNALDWSEIDKLILADKTNTQIREIVGHVGKSSLTAARKRLGKQCRIIHNPCHFPHPHDGRPVRLGGECSTYDPPGKTFEIPVVWPDRCPKCASSIAPDSSEQRGWHCISCGLSWESFQRLSELYGKSPQKTEAL